MGVIPLTGPGGKPVGTTKGIDIEAQGTINGVPVYEFDLNSIENEEKPWRKPGKKYVFLCLSKVFNCFSRQEEPRRLMSVIRRIKLSCQPNIIHKSLSAYKSRAGNLINAYYRNCCVIMNDKNVVVQ